MTRRRPAEILRQPTEGGGSRCLGSETRVRSDRCSAPEHATLDEAMQSTVGVGVGPVSFEDLIAVARHGAGVELAPDAVAAIGHAREVVEKLAAAATPAYGISTGFGALATRH